MAFRNAVTWDCAGALWYDYWIKNWRGRYIFRIRGVPSPVSPLLFMVSLKYNSNHVTPNLSLVPNSGAPGWNHHTLAWHAGLYIIWLLPTFHPTSLLVFIGSFCTTTKSAITHALFTGRESCPNLLIKFLLVPHDLSQGSSGDMLEPLRGLITPTFVWF